MKFNQYTWNLYKQSPDGQKAIDRFQNAKDEIRQTWLILEYNPHLREQMKFDAICDIVEDFWCYKVSEYEELKLTSLQEAKNLYEEIILTGLLIENEIRIKIGDYDSMLEYIPELSLGLNYQFKEYFIPYLYINRYYDLNKLADTFEIELPQIPKKPNYRARCIYYWDICEAFYKFRTDNNLSPCELSAFMYDYTPNLLHTNEKKDIPHPAQAWFIGGLIKGYEESWITGFWQSNSETKKGDILIHYETAPISAITCLWIAQIDGVLDPFAHYYSNTYIGNKIDILHITLKELQADGYFAKHPLIRKKFQGVNGWPMSSEDYSELLRMIKAKGFDTDALPKLYAPALPKNIQISNERDVEVKLLEPLLNSMEWYENKDFIRQLPIHAGRGHRVFPDYALHYENKPDYERAKVLIEAKFYMKNNQDVEETFKQARSYANILESSVIVLCDKQCLIVYEKKESFDRDRYTKYYWGELESPDRFNELKNKLNYK